MACFKENKNKKGETRWLFKIVVRIDPETRKYKYTTRREFTSKGDAELIIARSKRRKIRI
ncbi:hypothetical protein QUF88_06505 [Bacillus sp. DX1.1]|uniref:hypothetical protein n=1 Tax=Bacillus sp. DX1.1 TaxID=3055866 RepID=UPI0025A0856F|nr:hypothetical protein [Bacillus sp. DX1.1]MDM5153497.1 hypothetical protein [Bacillus sp. DX1.1]